MGNSNRSYSYFVCGNIKKKQTSKEEYNTLIINIVIFVVCEGIPYILGYYVAPFIPKNSLQLTALYTWECIILLKKYMYTFFSVNNHCLH